MVDAQQLCFFECWIHWHALRYYHIDVTFSNTIQMEFFYSVSLYFYHCARYEQ